MGGEIAGLNRTAWNRTDTALCHRNLPNDHLDHGNFVWSICLVATISFSSIYSQYF